MQKSQSKAPSSGGFSVQDVLYIVFKHKWKIIVLSLLGFGAAAAVFLNQKPLYSSTAKLLVRYVMETGTIDPYSEMKSPGGGMRRGTDPVILTEIEILRSLDLARDVAEAVRLENLQRGVVGPNVANPQDAAMAILGKLMVFPGESPNVLYLTYGNEHREVPKVTLEKLVELYFKKHLEIHRSAAAFDTVSAQTEEVRQRLEQTEKELNALRTETGIVSLADAISVLSSQKAKTQEDLMKSRADLAEQVATIESLAKAGAAAVGAPGVPATEEDAEGGPSKDLKAAKEPNPVPAQVVTEYRTVMELLSFLQKRDVELRIKFKTGNRLLSQNQQQIENYEARRRGLIEKHPDLASEAVVMTGDPKDPRRNLDTEKARLAAITAKIEVLKMHLDEIGNQFKEQYAFGARIEALDRKKQMEDAEFRSLEEQLKGAKLRQTLDPSRMPNITLVQTPTEPIKTYDEKIKKIAMGLAGGGIAIGVGLAFLIELLFDRRVKRPTEIQTRLQLPLLLSIPYIRRKDRGGLMLTHESSVPRIGQGGDTKLSLPGENTPSTTGLGKVGHFIHPYAETIRDRIIFNFEVNNLTHKPKLVAVTGLSEGAGASTVAAGLAKSFSDISGVKVLLVDLSSMHPEESPIFGEVHRHSLNGALQLAGNHKFRESKDRLYYASATARRDDSGLTTFSPMHLYELMPQLQASDFDYIIFDMPPIDQTSRTLTMAGLMDKVLLVLDADNTSRDALKWGYSELGKGKADVSCIFNKTRSHAPSWVIGES
jgi:succinoglycan biosynthesis transport protein ExoP